MSETIRQENTLLNKLIITPNCFDFFQALRLLEYELIQKKLPDFLGTSITYQKNLLDKYVKFCGSSTVEFPLAAITDILISKEKTDFLFQVNVSFMGLTGINSALPYHYTERLLELSHHDNFTLKDFFDFFNHSFILLFYRAWQKNHCFTTFNNEKNELQQSNFDCMLNSIAGGSSLESKQPKKYLKFYAGLFGGIIQSAVALESMLSDYFELPIQILQFQGKWLSLKDYDRSLIGSKYIGGQYNQLARDLMLGQRSWDIGSKFRIYIGPIAYHKFIELEPTSPLMQAIIQITKQYINAELNFDIQLELSASEIPPCILQSTNSRKLSWNTWLISKPQKKNSNAVIIETGKTL